LLTGKSGNVARVADPGIDGDIRAKTVDEIVARNVDAARNRLGINQKSLADRMRIHGFRWRQQTVAEIENSNRKVSAAELLGLALALETSIRTLLLPAPEDGPVRLPSGQTLDHAQAANLVVPAERRPATWQGRSIGMPIQPRADKPMPDEGEPMPDIQPEPPPVLGQGEARERP
jgi:transcriptional regulator with XRE-family HTH domain